MSDVWAAIDDETGEVCAIASTAHYTFSQAVDEFAPREVRRMDKDDAFDSGQRYIATLQPTGEPVSQDMTP